MSYTAKEYASLCYSYIHGHLKLHPLPPNLPLNDYALIFGARSRRALLIKILTYYFASFSTLEKIHWLREIQSLFLLINSEQLQHPNSDIDVRTESFKHDLLIHGPSLSQSKQWQESWLSIQLAVHHDLSNVAVEYTQNVNTSLSHSANRFITSRSNTDQFKNDSYALIGTTFMTNLSDIIQRHETHRNKSHVLDAIFSAYILNDKGDNQGLVMAVADGCSNHTDEAEDNAVAVATQIAVQNASLYCSAFNNPGELKANLNEIVQLVCEDIQTQWAMQSQHVTASGTTLAFTRSYPSRNGFRLIGANIGDCLICAFDGNSFLPISAAEVVSDKWGPAMIPAGFKSSELQLFDVELPPHAVLIAMSDGAYQSFPLHASYNDERGTKLYTLSKHSHNLASLVDELSSQPDLKDQAFILLKYIIESIEKKRESKVLSAKHFKLQFETELLELNTLLKKKDKLSKEEQEDSTTKEKIKPLEDKIKETKSKLDALDFKSKIILGDDAAIIITRLPQTGRLFALPRDIATTTHTSTSQSSIPKQRH